MSNIIEFPKFRKKEDTDLRDESLEFAYEMIHSFHDSFHDATGDCIFTDDDYDSLTFLLVEVLTGFHMKSLGKDHPMQEIADDLFDFVDNDHDTDYNVSNNDIEDDL